MYLFEIAELIPSSKDSGNHYKLKMLMREETKGAVSAITSCSGYFVVAVGQKVLIRALEINERLISVAFYDAGTYIVSLEVLKNFILVGDQVKSVTFLAFQVCIQRVECYFLTITTRNHLISSFNYREMLDKLRLACQTSSLMKTK